MRNTAMLLNRRFRAKQAGDKVSVTLNPIRTGEPGAIFVSVTLADGSVLGGPRPRGRGGAGVGARASFALIAGAIATASRVRPRGRR